MLVVAAVNRAYIPGAKFDHCLILQGGYFKSTSLRHWRKLVCELKEFREKPRETARQMDCWFAEMSVWKNDTETIKSFITEKADRFIPPYIKRAKDFQRTCVFGGSTNEDEFKWYLR